MSRLWDKGAPLDARVLRYTAGEDHTLDDRLVAYDAKASIAHAAMLHDAGLVDDADLAAICNGLREIADAHARGEWAVTLELEDGQTALETLLTCKIGAAGARLHAGRSRNDQVLAALRLYLRDAVEDLAAGARTVAGALQGLATEQAEVTGDLLALGQQIATTMVELFADLPAGHPFFEQFSFISAEDLPHPAIDHPVAADRTRRGDGGG